MMTIKFAKYAFKDLLKQFHYSGINEITITKEDNDLEVVISDKYLKPQRIEITNQNNAGCVVEIDNNGFPKLDSVISATNGPIYVHGKTSYNRIDPENIREFN